jgi:hypothetical protein
MYLPSFLKRTILQTVLRFGYVLIPDDYRSTDAAFEDTKSTFRQLYERVKPYTMTSIDALYAMHNATEYVVKAGIPGDIVECGVWRGGSMMMAALTLLGLGDTGRRLICFDTFAGHPRPDPKRDGKLYYQEWSRQKINEQSSRWANVSMEEVLQNIESTGYPMDRITLVKGTVEKTLAHNLPREIAILRLDTDWYESTALELRHLYPILTNKGVLIIDDYGVMAGARRAVDEYIRENEISLLLHRIDFSARIAVKP